MACLERFAASLFLVTTAGAFWFAPPATAQLAVAAPSSAQVQQMRAWYELHIPDRFRVRGPLLVRELNDDQMASYLRGSDYNTDSTAGPVSHTGDGDGGDIDGIFEGDPDRIVLRLAPVRGADMFTFAHEYGHYVWFHLLGADDRKRYEIVYKRQLAAHRLVTRYAATDTEEGFAEAFSFYVCEPLMLTRRDPQSFQFLKLCRAKDRA